MHLVSTFALLAALGAPAASMQFHYTLRIDAADSTGFSVELRIRNAPPNLTLAAAAHPEYDDRYWRYITALTVTDAPGNALPVTRPDSVLWRIRNPAGDVTVRYRLALPPAEGQRAAWRPFLSPTGGLVGGPHSFLYVLGAETLPATVALDVPTGWRVATGLRAASAPGSFQAPDLHTLIESPMLVGVLHEWSFHVRDASHRVFYWPAADATPFDTATFVRAIERLVRATVDLFGSLPYRDYTFLFQDAAYGGLEHPNSVTLGAPSTILARDPHALLPETAHEFVHTWNLMSIRPSEYRGLEYRTQPPVAGLWFSEGLTMFYADLLIRRAGLPAPDSTRTRHVEQLIARYLAAPGNTRFSAEEVSRVSYNAGPGALGDYTASTHLQGELIGTVLDLRIRAATDGAHSMDDVMRLMYRRFTDRGFTSADVENTAREVCSCSVSDIFDGYVRGAGTIDFNGYFNPVGMVVRIDSVQAAGTDGQPLRDLRVWGYEVAGEPRLRLMINHPASAWGRAGLHTGDVLISIAGKTAGTWPELRTVLSSLALGDTVTVLVERAAGPFETRVVVSGYTVPQVRIEPLPGATERQRVLRAAWLDGR